MGEDVDAEAHALNEDERRVDEGACKLLAFPLVNHVRAYDAEDGS